MSSYEAQLAAVAKRKDWQTTVRQLMGFVEFLRRETHFCRALSSPQATPASRESLLNDATKGLLNEGTVKLAARAPHGGRDAVRDYLEALERTALDLAIAGVGAKGLESLEDDLALVAGTIAGNPLLADTMLNQQLPNRVKRDVLRDLFAERIAPISLILVEGQLGNRDGRDVHLDIELLSEVVAERRGHRVAYVRTAIELDMPRRSALEKALEKAISAKISARYAIDESVLGGAIVKVGETVWDGSVRRQLHNARLALTNEG